MSARKEDSDEEMAEKEIEESFEKIDKHIKKEAKIKVKKKKEKGRDHRIKNMKKRIKKLETYFKRCKVREAIKEEENDVHSKLKGLKKVENFLTKNIDRIKDDDCWLDEKKETDTQVARDLDIIEQKKASEREKYLEKKLKRLDFVEFFLEINRLLLKFLPLFLAFKAFDISIWMEDFLKSPLEETWDFLLDDFNSLKKEVEDIENEKNEEHSETITHYNRSKRILDQTEDFYKCFLHGNLEYVTDFCSNNFDDDFFNFIVEKIKKANI